MNQIKIRYDSFDQFFRLNMDDFKKVQAARKEMKSPQDLGLSGSALLEAERLAYQFLNLKSLVSDLLFSVGASVLDAKQDIKNQYAIAYRDADGGVSDRKIFAESDSRVIKAHERFNDLQDLQDYLKNKYGDFESTHYYYKQIAQGKHND